MIKPFSRRSRFGGLLAAGAAALVIAAGCGGGGDSALSVDEYRDQANRICRDADRATDNLDPTNLDQLQQGIEAQRDQIADLRALTPPEEFEEQHNEALDLLDRALDLLDEARERIEGGESPTEVFTDLSDEITRLTDDANELAEDLGLEDCADDSSSTSGDADTTTTDPGDDTLTPTPDPGDSTDTDTTDSGDAPESPTQQYIQDATRAAGVLTSFGEALQGISNPDELTGLAPQLRQNLAEFDQAIDSMDGYTLDNAQLEAQRACLVQTGPPVSDLLGQFVTAAEDSNASAIQGLVPEIQSTLTEFTQAAQGNC